jgi:hypothetical protein
VLHMHEALQIGVVPWTFEGILKQLIRWGSGAIHQIMTWPIIPFRPFTHLNWIQRLVVFWHSTFYFMSITNVVLLVILFATLAFNLNLTIRTLDENLLLMSYLGVALLTHHLEFLCLWDNMTQSIQSWNHEDSFVGNSLLLPNGDQNIPQLEYKFCFPIQRNIDKVALEMKKE